jgi:hypothetical protein
VLLFENKSFTLPQVVLSQCCRAFADAKHPAQSTVQSKVSVELVAQFLDSLTGKFIEISEENFEGLSVLADEFGDSVLSSRLKASPVWASRSQAKAIAEFRVELQKLKADLSAAGGSLSSMNPAIARLESEIGGLHKTLNGSNINGLWKTVNELQSADSQRRADLARLGTEIPTVRKALDDANVNSLRKEVSDLQTSVSVARGAVECGQMDSRIVTDAKRINQRFGHSCFKLLWRGSRDGFQIQQFHDRCDCRPNTVTLILDSDGNIFDGFTPVM